MSTSDHEVGEKKGRYRWVLNSAMTSQFAVGLGTGQPLLLNSKKLTGALLKQLVRGLDIPTGTLGNKLWQFIDGKLGDIGHDPQDTQALLQEAENGVLCWTTEAVLCAAWSNQEHVHCACMLIVFSPDSVFTVLVNIFMCKNSTWLTTALVEWNALLTSRGVADIVSVTLPQKTLQLLFPPDRGLLKMTHRYTN